MYVLVQLRNRLRLVPLSFSPLCTIQIKENLAEQNGCTTSWGQEAREMSAFHPQNFTWPSFPQGFFTVMFEKLSKIGATRSPT